MYKVQVKSYHDKWVTIACFEKFLDAVKYKNNINANAFVRLENKIVNEIN